MDGLTREQRAAKALCKTDARMSGASVPLAPPVIPEGARLVAIGKLGTRLMLRPRDDSDQPSQAAAAEQLVRPHP